MNALQVLIGFLGRFCLSIIFLDSSINKFLNLQPMADAFISSVYNLMNHGVGVEWIQKGGEIFLPYSNILIIIAGTIELLGGLLILLGIYVRFGAFLLLIFLIPATLVFHHFWYLEGDERLLQSIMFLKNLAIFGGLLLVLAFGKGIVRPPPKAGPPEKKKT